MNWLIIAFLVVMYATAGHFYFSNLDLSGVICAQIDGPQEKNCP